MSIQAVAWALQQYVPRAAEKLVLVVLANHADHESGFCYPSIEKIAAEASMSARSVHTHLAKLVDQKLIRIEGGQKSGTSNRYFLACGGIPPAVKRSARFADPKTPTKVADPGKICRPGSATVCRPKNHQLNRHQTIHTESGAVTVGLPMKARRERPRVAASDRGAIEIAIASRIGPRVGDGLAVLHTLSLERVDELCAMERCGKLSEAEIEKLRWQRHAVPHARAGSSP